MIASRSNNARIRPPVPTWRVALLSCAFGLLPIGALAQTATGAPVQLGLPSGGPSGSNQPAGDDTGNDQPNYTSGGITATPLPPLPAEAASQAPDQMTPGQISGDDEVAPPVPGESISNAAPDKSANAITSQAAPGLIDDRQGGLGARMWQGSSVVKLTALLPQLPAPVTEPALRDLQLRLLLTQASGPTAAAGIDSLVPLRADRLHVMGFDAEALQLAQQLSAPGVVRDPREAVDRLWASDDKDGACSQVQTQIAGEQSLEPYWRRALVFCQILQGDTDQASIGVDLLREQAAGDPQTKDFIAVASVLLGDSKAQSLKKIASPDPLLAAMMKQAKLPGAEGSGLPKPVGAALAAATARDASKPLPERLQAGETAFATGLISADELTGLYRQVKPAASDAELAGADTPEHRARLYQRAQQGQMPESRLQWVTQALREARARGDYFSAAALYAPLLQMTPNPSLAQFAPEAARALFAAGNTDRAGFWLNLATGPGSTAQTARDAAGLRLLGRIAGLYGSRDAGTDPVADWRQAQGSGASDAAAQRLYGILAGLGESAGGHDATTFAGGNPDIATAAQAGRRGETVLLALVTLSGNGKKLAQADGAALAQSLGGLTAVGLRQDARRIGTEAAILAGL